MADGDAGVLPRIIQSVANLRHRTNTAATDVSARHRINWVDTASITWTVTDSSINDEVSVSGTGAAPYTLPSAVPLGTLGYAQATSDQTGIGTSPTDVTSLSTTVTVGASRRIEITIECGFTQGTAGGLVIFAIYEGATRLAAFYCTAVASAYTPAHRSVILTPSTGSHTYKAVISTSNNTVDLQADNGTVRGGPAFILVKDIGT